MAASRDQPNVRDEELLRRFVACRDDGDGDGARHWWNRLAEASFDRVRGMVDNRAYHYGFSHDEREEAVQRALVKLWQNMVHSFRGATMGEFVLATKSLVEFACMDVQRDAARRTEREKRLSGDPEKPHPEYDSDEVAQQRHRRDAEKREAEEFVGWALPQVKNERYRRVLELTLDGVPAERIAAELDVTMTNLYQLRSRGLKELGKLRDRWFEA
jgi:RNA polymerase sigma factor (sigma-70 family)